ncbi:MAG: ABC transporter ATP-binding protein [Clostridia bacterium]|nr:ABC transporter ATP-binding protein [Clostridia bacterium]
MNNQETILKISDLSISFKTFAGRVNAIRGIDLELHRGETLAIVGESGSGKSVTVKSVLGIHAANEIIDSGRIDFTYQDESGKTVTRNLLEMNDKQLQKEIRGKHIALVFQDPMTSLNPTMTIGAQIMESVLRQKGVTRPEARQRALELLQLVGITDAEKRFKNYPHQLSGGMRQRVVIAIALACDPDLLICDEPTTALDVTVQAKILDLIKDIQRKKNLTVIYITHDLGVVARVADTVAVMYAGKLVEKGSAEDLFFEPAHPYTWGLLLSVPDMDENSDSLYTIPGSPPNLLKPVEGDAFAPRNQYALEVDRHREPPMFRISETHSAATWLLHPDAPRVEMPEPLRRRIDSMREEVKNAGK